MTYLSVHSCLGYDAAYLREWIEFHRLVGVERFFLYNNGDRDTQRTLLAPYVEDGIVVLHEFPGLPVQLPAFQHCLDNHRDESRWIAFIDTDEFLFSPTETPLTEVLARYEHRPAVGVCRAFFSPGGHRTKPPGLVIESYRKRLAPHNPRGGMLAVKMVIDPRRTVRAVNPHLFAHTDGRPVDELERPIQVGLVESASLEHLRINHYWTRSQEEWRLKLSRLRPDTGEPYPPRSVERVVKAGVADEAILRYVAPLRERLAATQQRYGAGDPVLEPSVVD